MSGGASLRAVRIDLGVSLDKVAAATRVPLKQIEAIENDDLGSIPRVYARGYIRTYSSYLGLDPDRAVATFILPQDDPAAALSIEQLRPAGRWSVIDGTAVAWIGVLVLLAGIGAYIYHQVATLP